MNIGIDANEANTDMRVGVHQVALETIKAIYKNNKSRKEKFDFVVYLRSEPKIFLPKENKWWRYAILNDAPVWTLTKLTPRLLLNTDKIDLFYSPSHYLPLAPNIKMICTIHDLGYLKFSGQFRKYDFWQLKYWSAISISISKCIISVSEFTKKDIVRHYPFASKKIVVALNGYYRKTFNDKINENVVRRAKKKYTIEKKYILSLGTLKPSKNIEGIINAYSLLPQHLREEYQLVIAGKKGWLYDEIFKLSSQLNVNANFIGFVDEEDKPALLHGAKLFISPSFWEGFGIHILEAMACGTPVVVSKRASVPEVVGAAGIYVNEKDPKSIKKGILKILEMEDSGYNRISEKSKIRANRFGWEKTAESVMATFDKFKQ